MTNSHKRDIPSVVAVESTRMPMIFADATSASYNVIYANPSFLKLMGYTESEIVGKPFSSTLAKVQQGIPFRLKDCEHEEGNHPIHYVNAVRSNGEEFAAALVAAPISDSLDKTFQYFVCFVDLSKQTKDELAQQDRLRQIYLHTPGFIATTSGREHRITFVNQAYRALVGTRRLVGVTFAEAFPELMDQGFVKLLDEVFETKIPYSGRRVAVSLEREPNCPPDKRVIDFVYEPVVDAEGLVTGLFCQGFDVTDVAHTESKLRLLEAQYVELGRANAMGTMAATLAHELNQPLAAIANYASGCIALIDDGGSHDRKVQQGLQAIANASDRAGHIIRRLRDMTKRAPPVTALFDLTASLADSVQLVKVGSNCGIAIADHSAATGPVCADRIQVQQVMINLLKNACEAAGQDGDGIVKASIMRGAGNITVSITDNGPGISIEKQKTLFSWAESDKTEGMGMGLSISRTIIENQGGKIWLERTSDQGSEFAFSLPAARHARRPSESLASQGQVPPSSELRN